ncbi:hypothetical protein JCM1841_002746 [Sporobolomyces salmonicolor]
MWSKVARLASPAPRKASATQTRADEPTFVRIYDQLRTVLAAPTDARSPGAIATVSRHLAQILAILKVEAAAATDASLGPCFEFALREAAFATLVELVAKDDPEGMRVELVRWYSKAIVDLDESFLAHSAVNKPLVTLLRSCVDEEGGLMRDEELAVVETMCIVSERIKTRPELLAIFLRERAPASKKDVSASLAAAMNRPVPLTSISPADENGPPLSPTLSQFSTSDASTSFSLSQTSSATGPRKRAEHDFLLFAYLLRFIHREGDVGDFARRGLLCLCDVALGYPNLYTPSFSMHRSASTSTVTPSSVLTPAAPDSVAREAILAFAEYLLDSDFAEVLGAGLGALYGLLPSKLVIRTVTGGMTTANGDWDSVVAEPAGGMVLGGMGALGEEEDAEEVERKREEEELRLRAMGIALSGSSEVREGLDGFLKLVEFTQDVLKRSTEGNLLDRGDGAAVDETDDIRQQNLVMHALASAILTAVRDLFLQSVLYPSILECSEADGSAVAVMSYLDAMLEVIHEGTKLESAVLGFLMGEEESQLVQRAPRPSAASTSSPANTLSPRGATVKKRKSSALLLIEQSSTPQADASSYFTSLGRFSIGDLLVSHVHSSSQATATAALKLLQTMLAKHDRWSMALLDVSLDDGATSFPIVLREPPAEDDDDSDEQLPFIYRPKESSQPQDDSSEDKFVYASPSPATSRAGPVSAATLHSSAEDDDKEEDELPFVYRPKEPSHPPDDSSEDEFVYASPSPATPRAAPVSAATLHPSAAFATPAKALEPLFGAPLPPTPSVALHLDSLDTLLSLIGSIDPSYRQNRSMGGGSEMFSSAFVNYLRDAEASLAADQGFRRGIAAPPHVASEASEQPLLLRRRSTLFSSTPTLTGGDFAAAKTGYRHKLQPSSKLVALLLDSLSHFFSHSPDVNLGLTAVLAVLALCPYRSLEGWLLPVVRHKADRSELDRLVNRDQNDMPRSDDGDDRSVDFEIEERSRRSALLSPLPKPSIFDPSNPPPSATRVALATSNSLLSILDALVKSIEHYRATIPKFDIYLSERRRGLFFVENLADALHLDDIGEDSAFAVPAPPKAAPQAVSAPPATPVAKVKSSGLAGFFSPRRPSHTRSPSTPDAFATPPRSVPAKASQLRHSASDDSLAPPATPSGLPSASSSSLAPLNAPKPAGPVSPFAAHYRQTGAITIQPVIVSTPASAVRMQALASVSPPGLSVSGEQDDEDEVHEAPDSPTKRLSPLPPPSSSTGSRTAPSVSSWSGDAPSKACEVAAVSLSTVLDNVIVLEEFIKELAAIVYVRRAVGIDAVRFV